MKKSQAALEFLMTYGWAILVVMLALGALAYFGVFNPNKFAPNKCIFSNGLNCIGNKITDGQVIVVMKQAYDQSITNVTAELQTYNGSRYRCRTLSAWPVDTLMNISCGIGSLTLGPSARFKMNVTFMKRDGKFTQLSLGEVSGPVEFCTKTRVYFKANGGSGYTGPPEDTDLDDVACCAGPNYCVYSGNCYPSVPEFCFAPAPWRAVNLRCFLGAFRWQPGGGC